MNGDSVSTPRPPGSPRIVLPVLILAGIAAFAVDIPLSRFCHVEHRAQFAHEFLEHIEPFGQPTGLLIICTAIWLCDSTRGRSGVRIAMAAIGSGLAADVVKLCIARARPYHLFSLPPDQFDGSVWNSFRGILPLFSGGSPLQSFPSAHSAFVTGFCLALWAVYPKGRWLFLTVAVLVALQRIEGGSHYLSDTLFGAAVGYVVCLSLYGSGRAARRLTEWEAATPNVEAAV